MVPEVPDDPMSSRDKPSNTHATPANKPSNTRATRANKLSNKPSNKPSNSPPTAISPGALLFEYKVFG